MEGVLDEGIRKCQILKRIGQVREILNEICYSSYKYDCDEASKMIISKCLDELILEYLKLEHEQ